MFFVKKIAQDTVDVKKKDMDMDMDTLRVEGMKKGFYVRRNKEDFYIHWRSEENFFYIFFPCT